MAADGSIVIETELDDKQAQAELNRLTKKINALQDRISREQGRKLPLLEQAEQLGAQLDAAKAKLFEMQSAAQGTVAAESLAEQTETVKSLQAQWDSVQKSVEGYDRAISRASDELSASTERAGELSARISEAGKRGESSGNQISAAMEAAGAHMDRLASRIIGLGKRVFIFTVITRAFRRLRDYLWDTLQSSKSVTDKMAQLRAAFITLAQPLVNVLIPAFERLLEALTKIVTTAARIISKLFGSSLKKSAEQAQKTTQKATEQTNNSLEDEADALRDTAKAAEQAEKAMADFDEVQVLAGDSARDFAQQAKQKPGENIDEEPTELGEMYDFAGMISQQLDAITELFVGAALLALGAILTFSGANIPLGIALMVMGALAIWDAISENPDEIKAWLVEHAEAVAFALVSLAAVSFVVGILLCLTGHIALGIGLIVLGAVLFAATVAMDDGALKRFIEEHSAVIATALVAIAAVCVLVGLVLLFAGQVALGIALIVLGIVLFVTAMAMDADGVKNFIEEHSATIAVVLLAIAAVCVLVGLVLLVAGNIPIGIALILVGITLFVGALAIDSDAVRNFIEEHSSTVAATLLAFAAVAVVTGIVLMLVGNVVLGVALILIGIASFVAAAKIGDEIKGFIQEHAEQITAALLILGGVCVLVGIILLFCGKFLIGIGLIVIGIGLFVAAVMVTDVIQQFIDEHSQQIATALLTIGAICMVVGIVLLFTAHFLLGISLIAAGIGAFVAAVAVSEELQNWIKENMEKIAAVVQAAGYVMLVLGIILLITGVAAPIGLALVIAGITAVAVAETMDPDWDWLADKLGEALKNAADVVNKMLDGIAESFSNAVDNIAGFFDEILEAGKSFVDGILEIVASVKNALSEIWDGVTSLFGGDTGGEISGNVSVNSSGGATRGYGVSAASVPGLARGAVIPPNREFLAVLGDQRTGNNIEAPESALQAMADRAASANTELLREILRAIQAGKVIAVDGQQFGQVVNNANLAETSRIGARFVQVS